MHIVNRNSATCCIKHNIELFGKCWREFSPATIAGVVGTPADLHIEHKQVISRVADDDTWCTRCYAWPDSTLQSNRSIHSSILPGPKSSLYLVRALLKYKVLA